MRSNSLTPDGWRRSKPARRLVIGLLAVVAVLGASTAPVVSQTSEELESIREARRQNQAKAAAQAARVDASTAEVDQLSEALTALQQQVRVAQDRVADAERRLGEAEIRWSESSIAVAEKQAEIVELREKLTDRAISSFIGQGAGASPFIDAADPNEAVRIQVIVSNVTQDDVDVGEELRAAEEDLRVGQAIAADLAAEAESRRVVVAAEHADLDTARAAQAVLTEEAEARLDHELSEQAALESLGEQLEADEKRETEELAEELRKKRAAAPAPSSSSPSSSGQPSQPVSANEIVNAAGFWVHSSIAGQVEQMVAAASAAGIRLGGGGYRSPDAQIAVRKNNCGTSSYAIWEMPASRCRPPTARPGSSQHERGLAIDFTYNGSLIRSRNNDGFRWLSANAASYGFRNLPSEPWHWSTTGR